MRQTTLQRNQRESGLVRFRSQFPGSDRPRCAGFHGARDVGGVRGRAKDKIAWYACIGNQGDDPMSWHPAEDPKPGDKLSCDAIETVIVPRPRDLGGFEVRRALPSAQRQMVGPFIFFDQMGPSEFLLGSGIDVRPHPHIGLSTVTYLFDGEIMHRDSLGTELPIRPGELNWMTAGRGIVHSERTSQELRNVGSKLFGIQSWVALSVEGRGNGAGLRPLRRGRTCRCSMETARPCGSSRGDPRREFTGPRRRARCSMPTWRPQAGSACHSIPTTTSGRSTRSRARSRSPAMCFRPASSWCSGPATASRSGRARRALHDAGGEPMDGPRIIWWNFVSSRQDRIEQAKADWKAARFDTVPGDEVEFIPLPEPEPPPVRYA